MCSHPYAIPVNQYHDVQHFILPTSALLAIVIAHPFQHYFRQTLREHSMVEVFLNLFG
jgi:hypothetical protein